MGIFLEGTTFFSINRCKLVARLKCRCKCRPLLFNCGYILEPRINFRGLKWGIDFWLRSEIGFGKSKILVWKRVRVSSFELYTPTKNFGEYSPPFPGLWKTAIYYVTLVEKMFLTNPRVKSLVPVQSTFSNQECSLERVNWNLSLTTNTTHYQQTRL